MPYFCLQNPIRFVVAPEISANVYNGIECLARAFLSALNVDVDKFTSYILDRLPGDEGMSPTLFQLATVKNDAYQP